MVGRRCCAAGYDGRASAFALLQRDKATRPYRPGKCADYYREMVSIIKFANVYKMKLPLCQWRILHNHHSFVHSIK
jgi:hypothetical protein